MYDIVIRRCPILPWVGIHAQEINFALQMDFHRTARIEDGETNEFSVLVDGHPVLQRSECLPSVEEVEAAIQKAAPLEMSYAGYDVTPYSEPDRWLHRPTRD